MSASEARAVLNKLLDRIERQAERARAVSERLPQSFTGGMAAREAFESVLRDAERRGAVRLIAGRGEVRHLLQRVTLIDADALYAFLGRTPALEAADAAARRLQDAVPEGPGGEAAASVAIEIGEAWRAGRQRYGLGPDDLAKAQAFLTALAAVAAGAFQDRDMRTVSRKRTGSSKLIERHIDRLADWLRRTGQVDPGPSPKEALAAIGLEKFPQDVKIAGLVFLPGIDAASVSYLGLPPDAISALQVRPEARRLITIENLASFNRYVREARTPDEIVLYTGGYPSSAVGAAIAALAPRMAEIWHWGDIDAHGLRIAATVARHAGRPIRLHAMTPEIALDHGQQADPESLKDLDPALGEEFVRLVAFLASPDAHILEQEELDPVSPELPHAIAQTHDRAPGTAPESDRHRSPMTDPLPSTEP